MPNRGPKDEESCPSTAALQQESQVFRLLVFLAADKQMISEQPQLEVLTSAELAERLKVRESWVIDQSKRSRTSDPIPILKLGKHRRYRWGSPELGAWLERRAGQQHTRKAGSTKGETKI